MNSRRDAHAHGLHDETQNLSQEVHVTQHQSVTRLRALSACSSVVHLARVGVHVIVLVVDVVCLMLVLSARVVVHAVFVSFS